MKNEAFLRDWQGVQIHNAIIPSLHTDQYGSRFLILPGILAHMPLMSAHKHDMNIIDGESSGDASTMLRAR